jgi:hypothetical protein
LVITYNVLKTGQPFDPTRNLQADKAWFEILCPT